MLITVNGRLGRNAELVQGKNGSEFIKYSLAVDEYNPETKQNDTVWLNVLDATDRSKKMIQYLTKGKLINLVGNDRVTIFNGQNGPMISHDVRTFNWEFINSGRQDTTEATPTNAPTQTVAQEQANVNAQQFAATMAATTPSMGAFKQPVVTTSSSAVADDLPF